MLKSSGGSVEKNGRRLLTLEEWRAHAPPKGKDRHWKDGRSAKESAKSWLAAAPSIPVEIAETLSSHHEIGSLCEWRAEPEARVRFDKFPGEPSNLDILLVGRDENGPIVVAVEAKADEPFGLKVSKRLSDARSWLQANPRPRSNRVKRIEQLLAALFGATTAQADVLDLRYQLITLTAAAIAEAERQSAQRAVVMIHEFVTTATSYKKHASNARDLDRFVTRLSGRQVRLGSGILQGPFRVPGNPIVKAKISLFFGKARVNKR